MTLTLEEKILLESKAWKLEKCLLDKGYFHRLINMHDPAVLWIEAADTLLSVREITSSEPGQIQVYRNPGAQVREDDLSFMSVLEEALEASKIDLIVVCGYSHCAALRNVLEDRYEGAFTTSWLEKLRELKEDYWATLKGLSPELREKKLSELNVRQQIVNLSKLELIKNAWNKRKAPTLLGLYFDMNNGSLSDIYKMEPHRELVSVPDPVV